MADVDETLRSLPLAESSTADSELDRLRQENESLRLEIEALHGDFSAHSAEQERELEVRRAVCDECQQEADGLKSRLRDAQTAIKSLKSQNLDLQYHCNAWGIPVSSGSEFEKDLESRAQLGRSRFFPAIQPQTPGLDPVPIVLRGELSIFHLASLLGFLEYNHLEGVLTILHDHVATKLYISDGHLRLAAWNDRESVFSLSSLLVESELMREEEIAPYIEEKLYDLEIAVRLLYEGRLPAETIQSCLVEHARLIVTHLFQIGEGAFFLQQGGITFEGRLQLNLSITDLMLRTAAHFDEEAVADPEQHPWPETTDPGLTPEQALGQEIWDTDDLPEVHQVLDQD